MYGELSSDYSWEWVTASRLLHAGPCELVAVHQISSAATTGASVYNGDSANGKLIINLLTNVFVGEDFHPPARVYCDRGLYIVIPANVTGVFVQWRNL